MNAYVTIAFDHADLFPYFVDYYSRIGINRFTVFYYGCSDATIQTCRNYVGFLTNCLYVDGWQFKADEFSHGHRQRRIREYHAEHNGEDCTEWNLHADLDEFVELPNNMKTLQQLCANEEKRGSPLIAGIWLDRIALDNGFYPIDSAHPLETQYPMAGRFRKQMGMNQDVVVCARYAPKSHHPRGSSHWNRATKLNVHHFKWQKNSIERMDIRTKSQFVKGNHRNRVFRMIRQMSAGFPKEWSKQVGSVLGI